MTHSFFRQSQTVVPHGEKLYCQGYANPRCSSADLSSVTVRWRTAFTTCCCLRALCHKLACKWRWYVSTKAALLRLFVSPPSSPPSTRVLRSQSTYVCVHRQGMTIPPRSLRGTVTRSGRRAILDGWLPAQSRCCTMAIIHSGGNLTSAMVQKVGCY